MIHLPLFRLICRPRRVAHVIPRPRRIFRRGGVAASTKAALMGGLVCTAVPLTALIAPDALGLPWRQEKAPMHLVEAPASPLDALRADILRNPPSLFGTEAASSLPGSGALLFALIPPAISSPAGREPVDVPEPSSVAVFVAGVAGLLLARRARA
jgi:hypothetical protein